MGCHIGELNEQHLHNALKETYADSLKQTEVSVGGYVVDVAKNNRLIEIQTGNFSTIKKKLYRLVRDYPVKLVYPFAVEKWLLKLPKEGNENPTRRKSPKRGRPVEIFKELVSFPQLLINSNFSLELVMIQEEEVRRYMGNGRWYKNGWGTVERRLISIKKRSCMKILSKCVLSSHPIFQSSSQQQNLVSFWQSLDG
jgi:hypothetical protein